MNVNNDEEGNTGIPSHTWQRLTLSQPLTLPPQSKLRPINKSLCTVNSSVFIHVTFILRAVHQARRRWLI